MSVVSQILISSYLMASLLLSSAKVEARGTETLAPQTVTTQTVQLTKGGQNRQPLVHKDQGFFYISRNRLDHKDPQIYYKNFQTGAEKRITHQRGHIIGGIWMQDDKLVYASSTDEEKETPLLLRKFFDRVPAEIDTQFFFHLNLKPTEIYSSTFRGLDIVRLSNHMGMDAFPAYHPKKKTLYFSRFDDQQINIYSQRTGSTLKPKRALKTYGHDLGLKLSPKEDQFVWYRFSPDFKTSQLMLSGVNLKSPKYLTLDSGIHWTPSWHPNQKSILYSAKKRNDKNYNIYEIDIATECERKITREEGDEFYPVSSNDGTKILFTATKSGSEQIHQMDYPTTPIDCSKPQTTAAN